MTDQSKPYTATGHRARPFCDQVRQALAVLVESNGVCELRIPKADRAGTVSGYFDDLDRLTAEAMKWAGRGEGTYVTLNPVDPALLARAANRAKPRATIATSDDNIQRRRWLLIDCDPCRPSGISSTDEEHAAALGRARTIREELHACGWPEPVLADSGNGSHLLYRIELQNDAAARELVVGCLEAVAFRYSDEAVDVDTTVGNAGRIVKLYGTLTRKGDNTPERPHRPSRLLEVPDPAGVVSSHLLDELAATRPQATVAARSNGVGREGFDFDHWLEAHSDSLSVARSGGWKGGRRWILRHCPFNPEHTGGSAALLQLQNGAIAFVCHHKSCRENKWHDLRDLVEPGWRDRSRKPAGDQARGERLTASPKELAAPPDPPPDLASVLDDVVHLLLAYVVFASQSQTRAVALWIALTHLFHQFDTAPYLAITSAEKRSGKTRLLDLLELFVARAWRAVLPSDAVVYRKISKDEPTLLLDEVDSIYGPKAREHEGLRSLLNAGHRRGVTVPRCVGVTGQIEEFAVFSPKAIAGIGDLPDTVADRSIPIRLARRKPGDPVQRFRYREVAAVAGPIHDQLAMWACTVDLSDARPQVPIELNDRAADSWEPLLAIADAAGDPWPRYAREAAVELHADPDDREDTLGVRLLADLWDIFNRRGSDAIFTATLLDELWAIDEAPWGDLRGRPLKAHGLARLLRRYGIRPGGTVRVGTETAKGYHRSQFSDAWARYLSVPSSHRHNLATTGAYGDSEPPPESPPSPENLNGSKGCDDVTEDTPKEIGTTTAPIGSGDRTRDDDEGILI